MTNVRLPKTAQFKMKVLAILTLGSRSKIIAATSICLMLSSQGIFAQEGNLLPTPPEPKLDKPPVVSFKGDPDSKLKQFAGDEVFYKMNKEWGFKLNLSGFNDLRASVRGMTIVGFGVREDSVGLTLAHLYVNSFAKNDSTPTAKFYSDRLYKSLQEDSTLTVSSLTRKKMLGFETVSYDRIEVWPQPDPNNPGKMFDSTLVRRHFNAITTYRNSWIDIHLSKTEYQLSTPAVFTDIIKTFEVTENFERKKITPVKIKSVKKP